MSEKRERESVVKESPSLFLTHSLNHISIYFILSLSLTLTILFSFHPPLLYISMVVELKWENRMKEFGGESKVRGKRESWVRVRCEKGVMEG